ncbi:MAG TPA: hypothetical protein VNS09_17195 [Solirubrobacter sp.]|nr:hypothetical protein [Solirubrobacter sp.]
MTAAATLLARHAPHLVYDSRERYFADAAAIWTDSPTNVLKRLTGAVIATPPTLSLAFLGPHVYADGTKVLASDTIGDTTRDYAAHAAALHAQPRYRDRVHGHARADAQGRLWLQYWLFYYYNDFQIVDGLSGGDHEGDWELVQIRLNAAEQPEQVVCSQHKTAQAKAWPNVPKQGTHPVVHVARGSHANYFTAGPHWTGIWFDETNGKGRQVTPTVDVLGDATPDWVLWPGAWGDTRPTASPLDSGSPLSPGVRPHWLDPSLLKARG